MSSRPYNAPQKNAWLNWAFVINMYMRAERKSREFCVCAHTFMTKRRRQNVHRRTEKTVMKKSCLFCLSSHTHTKPHNETNSKLPSSLQISKSFSLLTSLDLFSAESRNSQSLLSLETLVSSPLISLWASAVDPQLHMLSEWYISPRFWGSRLHVVLSFLY